MKSLLLLLLLLPCIILAQTSFEYKVGKPYEPATYYFSQQTFLDSETGNHIKIRNEGIEAISIEIRDINTLQSIKYETLENLPKGFRYVSCSLLNKKLYCFYATWSKKIGNFYAIEIDLKTCQFKGSPKLLFETTKVYYGETNIYAINDDTKLVVMATPMKEKGALKYEVKDFHIFDAGLNLLASGETKMPHTEGKMDLIMWGLIDKNNHPVFLAKVRSDESGNDYKESDINYHLEVLRFNLETKSILTTIIETEQNDIKGIRLFIDHNKTLKCTGFYSKNPKVDLHLDKRLWGFKDPQSTPSADGIFVFEIDSDNNTVKKNFHEIPLDVITQYESPDTKKYYKNNKDKAELRLISMRGFSLNKDNSFLLLGEQRYMTTDDNGGNATNYMDDILATKIDSNGEIVWMSKIPKRGEATGYFPRRDLEFLNTEDKIYLFSWDHSDNLKVQTNEEPHKYYKESPCFLACCIDQETGEVEKKIIFNKKEQKNGEELSPLKIEFIEPVSDNSVIITLKHSGKQVLHVKLGVKNN